MTCSCSSGTQVTRGTALKSTSARSSESSNSGQWVLPSPTAPGCFAALSCSYLRSASNIRLTFCLASKSDNRPPPCSLPLQSSPGNLHPPPEFPPPLLLPTPRSSPCHFLPQAPPSNAGPPPPRPQSPRSPAAAPAHTPQSARCPPGC